MSTRKTIKDLLFEARRGLAMAFGVPTVTCAWCGYPKHRWEVEHCTLAVLAAQRERGIHQTQMEIE